MVICDALGFWELEAFHDAKNFGKTEPGEVGSCRGQLSQSDSTHLSSTMESKEAELKFCFVELIVELILMKKNITQFINGTMKRWAAYFRLWSMLFALSQPAIQVGDHRRNRWPGALGGLFLPRGGF